MTCAFRPCGEVTTCALTGGRCLTEQFPPAPASEPQLQRAKALNGTKPARVRRDPTWVPRKRKAL